MTASEQQSAVDNLQAVIRNAQAALSALGVQSLPGGTEEGMLRSNLSAMNDLAAEVSRTLGYTGSARGLPDFAAQIMARLPRK